MMIVIFLLNMMIVISGVKLNIWSVGCDSRLDERRTARMNDLNGQEAD